VFLWICWDWTLVFKICTHFIDFFWVECLLETTSLSHKGRGLEVKYTYILLSLDLTCRITLSILLLHSVYWSLSYTWSDSFIRTVGMPFYKGKTKVGSHCNLQSLLWLNWVWLPFKSNVSPITNMEHGLFNAFVTLGILSFWSFIQWTCQMTSRWQDKKKYWKFYL